MTNRKPGGCPMPPPPRPPRPKPVPDRPIPPPPPPPVMPGPCCPPTSTLVLNNTVIKSEDGTIDVTEGYDKGRPAYFLKLGSKVVQPIINGRDPIHVTEEPYDQYKNQFVISVDTMTGATANNNGKTGVVPAPNAGEQEKYLRGDGTWVGVDQEIDPNSINAVSGQAVASAISEVKEMINSIGPVPIENIHGIVNPPSTIVDPLDFDESR